MGVSARIYVRTDESPTLLFEHGHPYLEIHSALLFDGRHGQRDKSVLEGRMEYPRSSNLGNFALVQRPRHLCH